MKTYLKKTILALLVSFYTAGASSYTEIGRSDRTQSWESAEYLKDWGLSSMNTSIARNGI